MDSVPHDGNYAISSDKKHLDLAVVHGFLSNAYWSPGIPLEIVRRAIENSLCFGIYSGSAQVGFARVVTDQATFAYLADVFILEPHRGKGLSTALIQVILDDPRLQGLRRFLLATRDAHDLYRRFGFGEPARSSSFLEILRPNAYLGNEP